MSVVPRSRPPPRVACRGGPAEAVPCGLAVLGAVASSPGLAARAANPEHAPRRHREPCSSRTEVLALPGVLRFRGWASPVAEAPDGVVAACRGRRGDRAGRRARAAEATLAAGGVPGHRSDSPRSARTLRRAAAEAVGPAVVRFAGASAGCRGDPANHRHRSAGCPEGPARVPVPRLARRHRGAVVPGGVSGLHRRRVAGEGNWKGGWLLLGPSTPADHRCPKAWAVPWTRRSGRGHPRRHGWSWHPRAHVAGHGEARSASGCRRAGTLSRRSGGAAGTPRSR